jgi:proteic killer suppression protein
MIKSFRCKETEKIFHREYSRKRPENIQKVALRKLRMIHQSRTREDLKVSPANRLEKLSGRKEGQYSIRINDQWRICFEWQENNAFNVEIVDYH